MKERKISLPELGLIAGTRFALGAGVGLLLADCLDHGQRRAAGWALALVGALTTIPLAMEVLGKPAGQDFQEPIEKPDRRSATLVGL
ncbi:MAG TPA: hypothetical protein VND64_34385 [Pirellulales bacterium]|nr:hypothetical protein [Pirellulales bacterium]